MPGTPDSLKRVLADRCRIDREIGRGGMATVYVADDLKHHRSVTLEILAPEIAMEVRPESVCECVCRSTRSYRISMTSPTT